MRVLRRARSSRSGPVPRRNGRLRLGARECGADFLVVACFPGLALHLDTDLTCGSK